METSLMTTNLTDGSEVHAVAFQDGSSFVHLHCEDRKAAELLQVAMREHASFSTIESGFVGRIWANIPTKPAILPVVDHAPVLAYLALHGGALLYWQVPAGVMREFEAAYEAGAIRLNDSDDCYVHPNAHAHRDGSYTMNPPDNRLFKVGLDGGFQCTLAEMLTSNPGNPELRHWLRHAKVGDVFEQMHAETVTCIAP